MADNVIINPVTRISGFLEVEANIENHYVTEAKTKGMMFRGFEQMLEGRNPFDAVYFTERICGICSTAHGCASAMALEDALGIDLPEQGRILRDIMHASEFLQNHIRHFYQFSIPDYVKIPVKSPLYDSNITDYRIPAAKSEAIVENYFYSLEYSRMAHEMLAVFGGKAPHNHGIFPGGVTFSAYADKIITIKTLVSKIKKFIEEKMLPDVYEIANYYPEYYRMGRGYGNFLSYGCFDRYNTLGTLYVNPLVYSDGRITNFSPENITQYTDYSFHKSKNFTQEPGLYTWIKAPRYNGKPFEVGPLARMWLSGIYRNGISAMDRLIARSLEAKKITEIIEILIENIIPGLDFQQRWEIPDKGEGSGLIDTTRGALGHWIIIDGGRILAYQVISPSTWNLSPQTNGMNGPSEQALIGTYVEDPQNPVEIGRVIRTFDPCVSCATHVFNGGRKVKSIRLV